MNCYEIGIKCGNLLLINFKIGNCNSRYDIDI